MKFNCDSCGQRYAISDEKARGKVLKIRCRKCSHVIVVRGEPAGAGAAATPETQARAEPRAPEKPQVAARPEPEAKPRAAARPKPEAKPEATARPQARSRPSREAPALDLEPQEERDRTRMMSASSLQDALAASRAAADDDDFADDLDAKTTMMSLADLDRAREASAAAAPEPEPEADEEEDEDEGWYAVIGGKQQGPFDDDAFAERVASGRITERTYVWREGMDDWLPAKAVPVLAVRFAAAAEDDHPLETLAASVSAAPPPAAMAPPADEAPAAEAPAGDDDLSVDIALGGAEDADAASPAPEPAVPPSAAEALDALFEDVPEAAPGEAAHDLDLGADNALDDAIHEDPFASVPDAPNRDKDPKREDTNMFILASGVNKRKSPLRIAAFVLSFLAVLGSMGYLVLFAGGIKLSSVLPIARHRAAAGPAGPADPAAAARLRAQLMGGGRTAAPKPKAVAVRQPDDAGTVVHKEKPKVATLDASQKAALAALYGDNSRGALAIKVQDTSSKGPHVDSDKSPIDPKIIARKIGANQRAFQGCVQQELRRDPTFKGGRVTLTLSVAPSGIVTHASLDRRDLADSDVGQCITGASKRIVFPSFAGDDPVDFQIPLVLSTGY